MKKLLASMALLLCAIPAMAQDTTPIKVAVRNYSDAADDVGVPVRAAIIIQLSANPHYALVSDSSWDVELWLNCLNTTASGVKTGIACAYTATFAPDGYGGLSFTPGPGIITSSSDASAANLILSNFLEATTSNEMKKQTDALQVIFNHLYAAIMDSNKQQTQASAHKDKL